MASIVDYALTSETFLIVCGVTDIKDTSEVATCSIKDLWAGTLGDVWKFIPEYTTGKCAIAKKRSGEVIKVTRNKNWCFETRYLEKFVTKDDEKALKAQKFLNSIEAWMQEIGAVKLDQTDDSNGHYYGVDSFMGYNGDWVIKVWPQNCTSKSGTTMSIGIKGMNQNITSINSSSARRSIEELKTRFIDSIRYTKANSQHVTNLDDMYVDIFGGEN